MVERRLDIGIGQTGAAETKAEIDGVTESIKAQTVEEIEATAAEERRAKAVLAVGEAQSIAMARMGEFVLAAVNGGKAAEEAMKRAGVAVANLEVAIGSAQKIGAPVSPSTINILLNYDAALAAATAETEALEAATTSSAASNRILRAEAQASTAVMGQFGRAIGTLAQGTDSWVSSLAKAALPLLAVAAAAFAVNKALGDLKERGVDVGTIGSVMEHAMDAVAVALGGTSKAAAEAEKGFKQQQDTLTDLDATTRSYATALDLLNGLHIDATAGMALFAAAGEAEVVVLKSGVKEFENAEKAAHDFNQSLKDVRATSPGVAQQISKDLQEIAAAAASGDKIAVQALRDLIEQTKQQAAVSRALLKQIQEDYGKDAPAAFGKFSASALDVEAKFKILTDGGLTQAQAYDKLKNEYALVQRGAQDFAAIMVKLAPEVQAAAAHALDLGRAYTGVQIEIDKANKILQQESITFNAITKAVQDGTEKYGSHKIAINAVGTEIDALIKKLDGQRDADGELTQNQTLMYDSLVRWRDEAVREEGQLEKLNKAIDTHAGKIHDLIVKEKELTEAKQKQIDKINDQVAAQIKASEASTKKLEVDLTRQVKDVQAAYASREISDTEYNTRINTLFANQAKARADEYEHEKAINEKAEKDKKEVAEKYTEADTKIKESLIKLAGSMDDAQKVNEAFVTLQGDVREEITKTTTGWIESKAAVDKHIETSKAFAKHEQETLNPALKATNDRLQEHRDHHTQLHTLVPTTTRHVSELGQQFTTTAGQVPQLDASLDGLVGKLNAVESAAKAAAAALATVTEGAEG